MRAVWLQEFGAPEVLVAGEAPEPVPGDGQVLIEVEFANVTFVETQIRAGRFPSPMGRSGLPSIPGNGVGGVVVATGSGVAPALRGTRVVSSTGGSGGYAERVAVDAAGVIEIPEGVGTDTAVALLADGRTAMALIRAAKPGAGTRVLVEAAGGGVGSLLVQLARRAGATVIAAAGSAHKLELTRTLGAEIAVDYRSPTWTKEVRAAIGAVDVVFDGVGGAVGRSAFELLDKGGQMVMFGIAAGAFPEIDDKEAAERGVTLTRGISVSPELARELTTVALAEAAAGRLTPVIGQRFPLDKAAVAHAEMENRATVGKTLLIP
ncbi:zinc-binding dehydrogenase [Longimycelium tulufanense]|nr:zinc-binding dehydrogenase [Longimycelium tulufanense]